MSMEEPTGQDGNFWEVMDGAFPENDDFTGEGVSDPTAGIVHEEVYAEEVASGAEEFQPDPDVPAYDSDPYGEAEILVGVYMDNAARALDVQPAGESATIHEDGYATERIEFVQRLYGPGSYYAKRSGLFVDADPRPNGIAGVDLEYASPEGRALLRQHHDGVTVRLMSEDGRTTVCNHYYESTELHPDSPTSVREVIRKYTRDPGLEDGSDPDNLPGLPEDEVDAMRARLERAYLSDRDARRNEGHLDPVADIHELKFVNQLLADARPISRTYNDVRVAIGRQLLSPQPKPEPVPRRGFPLRSDASRLFGRVYDAYHSEVMTPGEEAKGHTKRVRQEPNDGSITEVTTGHMRGLLLGNTADTFISLNHTQPARVGDIGIDPALTEKRGWSGDTACELNTYIRFIDDGDAVSAEVRIKIGVGRRTWLLDETQLTPSVAVMRTLRNYVWGHAADRI